MLTDSEILDRALQTLVDMETDIPCDEMYGYDYCEKHCAYDYPVSDCWKMYLSGNYKESGTDENG